MTALAQLRELLAEVADMQRAGAVLAWDQQTYMPEGGVADRSAQMSTLRRIAHERFISDGAVRVLEAAEQEVSGAPFDSDDASLARVTRRDLDLSRRIPSSLIAEATAAGATAHPVWVRARAENDWSLFAPHLAHNVELNRRLADAIGYEGHPYDALLERSEPGMTVALLQDLFAQLRDALVPMLRAVASRGDVRHDFLERHYPDAQQLEFAVEVIRKLGYDLDRGRQDLSPHPFCISFGPGDVRITTRVSPDFLPMCLFGSIHESGHAMYNQGVPRDLDRTPLWGGASPGVHESQSRLWENLVGRSRPFWTHFFPELRERFPSQLSGVDEEAFYRAVNRVTPSLIRVEADELTYNLHILLRFELELELLDGRLKAGDVPEAWNARMREYVGVEPGSVSDGPLQDIHWSGISFGGFPSYTIGNVIGAQLMERIRADLPDLDARVERGEFEGLLQWLQGNVYRHGRKFTPEELMQRVTGSGLRAEPWIEYARRKFGEIYGF